MTYNHLTMNARLKQAQGL